MTTGDAATSLTLGEDIPRILVGISFEDAFRAQEFMTGARRLASKKQLILEDLVLVIKNTDGKTTVTETTDLDAGRGALSGAWWAGLFGLLLGGPVGWVAGMGLGAGAGVVAAKFIDLGISDDWVTWFRDTVTEDSATVVMLISEVGHEALLGEARRFAGAHLVYASFDNDMIDRLALALGDSAGPESRPENSHSSHEGTAK